MKDDFPDNPVNEDSAKDADFKPEDFKTSFGTHSRPPVDEEDDVPRKKRRKPEWEEITDDPRQEAGDAITNILTDEPVFPEDTNDPYLLPPPEGAKPDDKEKPQEPKEFVSNYITIARKEGQPPKDKVMMKALEQAIDQGWEKIYVFDKTQRKPDIAMAQYIQSFIEQKGFADKICCCCDADEYKSAGTARKIHKNNLRSGATRGKNMEFK